MSLVFVKKSHAAPITLALAFLLAGASMAEAGWSRKGSGVGPRGGTWSSTGSGSCAGGSCASTQTFTGPAGGTTTRHGSTTCSGGTCNHSATVTGPNGNGYTRSGSFARY
jgi:hypothetical protein